jgi:hypothetical protein
MCKKIHGLSCLLSFIFLCLSGCSTIDYERPVMTKIGMHHPKKEGIYVTQVKQFTSYLDTKGFSTASLVLAVSAIEPAHAIASILRMYRGQTKNFHEYNANPRVLTKEQARMWPVLLLHGDKHNQSAFIPMLDYFYKKGYSGPIFTVNIPSVKEKKQRQAALDEKLDAIDALYKAHGVFPVQAEPHLRCLIIGHSRGADEAVEMEGRDPTKRPLILMGALKHSTRQQPQVYINAVEDEVLHLPSQEMDGIKPVGEIIEVNTGHLGLLSHPDVLKKCYEVIVERLAI